jgi:hypothetical protein
MRARTGFRDVPQLDDAKSAYLRQDNLAAHVVQYSTGVLICVYELPLRVSDRRIQSSNLPPKTRGLDLNEESGPKS